MILAEALSLMATDIHITINDDNCRIMARGINGMKEIKADMEDIKLFNYLQYEAHLNISMMDKPQSGSFSYFYAGRYYDFRFAVINTVKIRNGVLRILNYHDGLSLDQLTDDQKIQDTFIKWINNISGLIIFSGLTGSGKTTTIYSLLKLVDRRTVYSLEDPVEVTHENMIQLEINPKIGLTYDEGIKQILRHDPDIIMIGEIRDKETARMTVRAALTGCLVITSLHARNLSGAVTRLLELGVQKHDLRDCLTGLSCQRLVRNSRGKYCCVYDVADEKEISEFFLNGRSFIDKLDEKQRIMENGYVSVG